MPRKPTFVAKPLFRWLGLVVFMGLCVLGSLWFLGGVREQAAGRPLANPVLPADQASLIERGRYLARIGNCAFCHTRRGGAAFAGGRAIDTPFGAVYSSNITPDAQYGLGGWTADDFWRALHHGVSRSGRLLYPAFPYTSYTLVSRADADALFAWLQSLPASATANTPHALRWPYNTELALRVWRALYFQPATPLPNSLAPATEEAAAARGEYLVNGLGHCLECHSARNLLGGRKASGKGGAVLPGSAWFAPSLFDTAEASVAHWTQAEAVAFLTSGSNTHAQASGPMAEVVLHSTQYLHDADAQAMAGYLRALPQVPQKPPIQPSEKPASMAVGNGARLYEQHCANCHGLQGQGQPGAYPALAGNRMVLLDNSNNPILSVMQGGFAAATAGNPRPYGMPPFMLRLSDAELAQVLSYVRTSWGNQAAPVLELDINTLRQTLAR